MPTHEESEQFWKNWRHLTPEEKRQFKVAVGKFLEDLRNGGQFRGSLRVKGVQLMPGCNEMTWADDGRAIWTYGPEVRPGEPHIVWIAVGGHDIFP